MSVGALVAPLQGLTEEAALPAPLFVPRSGLWVESEHAQFLVTAAGFRDARGRRDGLLARGQFEHSEAAIERGCPRIAALRNRAVGETSTGGTFSSMPPPKT